MLVPLLILADVSRVERYPPKTAKSVVAPPPEEQEQEQEKQVVPILTNLVSILRGVGGFPAASRFCRGWSDAGRAAAFFIVSV